MAPSPEIWIGLDTGGTYTDAVALDGQRRVVASAKALTTHWDLSIGLGEALRAVLGKLPPGAQREHIALVSVSTTLATNAVVENRFSEICTILIGFDEKMVERSGLKRAAGGVIVRVRGGHDPTGEESEPLDESAVDAAVREFGSRVEAFAVASMFSVRNPAHERRARERIRSGSDKPVTCSHELSSQLDAPKRALTAALNARLTPQIAHLLDALRRVLERESISAPVMIVKGDGTLMKAEVALEYPVETVLSGPAASVVGAGFLSGLENFAVADMGGTTTDVAIVAGGRPVVRAEGAVIGGWRTMVRGDRRSHLRARRRQRSAFRPRAAADGRPAQGDAAEPAGRAVSRGATRAAPAVRRRVPAAVCPAVRVPQSRARAEAHLDRLEQRVWRRSPPSPRRLAEVARTGQGVEALRRLVDRGLATLAGFTPSDAMHVLGRQQGWNVEAARLGAAVLATEERNASGRRERDTPEGLCERTYQHVAARGVTRGPRERARA